MAYLEHNWTLSDQQTVEGTANSTNVIDLTDVRDLAEGTPLYVLVQVVTADFAGEATLKITGCISDSTSLTSPQEIIVSPDLSSTNLTLNSQFFFPLRVDRRGEDFTIYAFDGTPTSVENGKRYFGLKYTVTGSDFTAGAVTASLTLDTSTMPRIYPASTST